MLRRELLLTLPAAAIVGAGAAPSPIAATVRAQAQSLARKPYSPPAKAMPPGLQNLSYDAYRDIRFEPGHSIWRGHGLGFELQMFHRSWLYGEKVDLYEVVGGKVRPIAYSQDLFTFGRVKPGPLPADFGFAGFRIHAPINRPDYFDELAVFQGASYFRAAPKGAGYGLSARGLALGAGESGEEFPIFRTFWIERPAPGAKSIVLHALLDSQSCTGAYRFVITAGEETTMEVQAELFARKPIGNAGFAPLTSMYLVGPEQPRRFDDFRPEVHDSDGLAILNGAGERLWRPLVHPKTVQTSAFKDAAPRGFGLCQRQRSFAAYQDLEAHYHARPDVWVEPLSGFGAGDVRLSELPAKDETEDNIAACWRPAEPLSPGKPHRLSYRLHWRARSTPAAPYAASWREGQGKHKGARRFIVDFEAPKSGGEFTPDVSASNGKIVEAIVHDGHDGHMRLSFEFEPEGPVSDLRAALTHGGKTLSEVWTYRWLA